MNRYITRFLLMISIFSLACAGCAAGKKTEGATLSTVSMFGEGDSAESAYQDLIADFQQAHPEILVQDDSEVSSEQWKNGVLDSFLKADTTPDVLFFFTGSDVRRLILNDQLVSLEEIRQMYPDYCMDIRESTMAFMREFDGNHYAVPVKGFWEGLFCNQDLFLQYGAPLPYDWDSFEKSITIFADNGIVPVAASLKEVPHYWIEHLILSEGGAIEHRLNPKGYVPESWVEGIDWFRKLYGMRAFPQDTLTMDNASATELFLNKKAAMTLDGSWLVQSVTDTAHTLVVPLPAAPGGKMREGDIISGYSSGFYITRKAWEDPVKRDAAVQFVSFMASAQGIEALCAMGGAPAMDIAQKGTDSVLQESANRLQQNAGNACMPIDSKLSKDAWQSLCKDIPNVVLGRCTAREAVEHVAQANQWK